MQHLILEAVFPYEIVIIRGFVDLVVELPADYVEKGPHEVADSEYNQDHAQYPEYVAEHDPPHDIVVVCERLRLGLACLDHPF